MNKIPAVIRSADGVLSGESALEWCRFLRDEADMDDDFRLVSFYEGMINGMKAVTPAGVTSKVIETQIRRFTKV